jgi:hypothetical protein
MRLIPWTRHRGCKHFLFTVQTRAVHVLNCKMLWFYLIDRKADRISLLTMRQVTLFICWAGQLPKGPPEFFCLDSLGYGRALQVSVLSAYVVIYFHFRGPTYSAGMFSRQEFYREDCQTCLVVLLKPENKYLLLKRYVDVVIPVVTRSV